MRYIFCWLILFSSTLIANPLPVNIVSDVLQPEDADKLDMGFRILLNLTNQLEAKGRISAKLIPASRLREWRELISQPDVCLYNKVKTPERERFAKFTAKPIVAFPPNRFVVHKTTTLPSNVSLAQILKDNSLRIGAVSGRAYSKHIDALFKAHNGQIVWISGKDAAKRLRLMFAKGKFDAVIEYSATFISEPGIDVNQLSFHKLDEAGDVVFGYIACANSELGKAVIEMYNKLLSKQSNQKMIVESHYVEFFGQEAYFLQEAIAQKLKEP
ncbi:ABC transporter substrate-binding protein [Pseudoalteromonas sp.]|uniref:ABC transporter substrate-binding protein n=1 Tax=Pseudoalteromonas sp. TaxID=53249 RepID=UPI0035627146